MEQAPTHAEAAPSLKVCVSCGQEVPLEAFFRNGRYRRSYCKRCDLARRNQAGWGPRTEAQRRARDSRSAERRRERVAIQPDERRRHAIRQAARRARTPPCEETASWARLLQGDPCAYCGAPTEHIDHIEPLARGGEHAPSNLTASCSSCNVRKSNRSLLLFLLARYGDLA